MRMINMLMNSKDFKSFYPHSWLTVLLENPVELNTKMHEKHKHV